MSGSSEEHGMSDQGLIPDERLVELLLARTDEARRQLALLRARAGEAERIDALERLFASTQAAVERPFPPARERAFVARVLESTTREDLSWRGDLRLVVDHIRARLRESKPLRYVAALLFANLTLGPMVAVAWVLTQSPQPERELFFRLQPREESALVDEAAEPLAPVEADDEPAEIAAPDEIAALDEAALAASRVADLLRRARYLLAPANGAVPADVPIEPSADSEGAMALRLLAVRTRIAHGEAWPAWLDDARFSGIEAAGDPARVEAALYLELLLDRFALHGDRAPLFHAAFAAAQARATDAGDLPGARLEQAALERAAAYGLIERTPDGSRPDPVDDAWRALLGEALGKDASDPRAAAWLTASR